MVSSPLLEHLRAHPEGVLPIEVARGLLALRGPTDVIEIIARAALLSLPGATLRPDGRVRLDEDASPTPTIALVLRSTGPYPPQDFLLEIGLAIIERLEIVAVYSERILPDRLLPPDAVRAAGVEPASLALGSPIDTVLSILAPLLDGATIVTFAERTEFDFLRRILDLEEREEIPGDHVPLAPSLRRAGAMPPRGDLLTAARTLRVRPPEAPGAGEFARTLGEIYLAALDRGIEFKPPAEREEFDFGKTKFGVDLLKELPERPGVYRFLDRNGRVLYVGKSKNLRARVTGYFGRRAKRRRKHADLMEQVVDLRVEETGSDLAALLRETELIREHAPPFNVQREIKRRRPRGGDLVIFLPGAGEGEIELLFVRDGAPGGRARSDRKAVGMREIRRAVARIYFSNEAPAAANEEDAQILATWLHARRDARNFVDLSEVAGKDDAARRIREYLTDPELFCSKFFRR